MAPSLPSSALVVVNRDGLYPFDESVWERFWAKVDVRGVDECWEWQGSRHPQGYGQLGVGQRTFRAHRIIASALVGRHLRGAIELACHRCDNPPCVNPNHIFVGDALENSRDMVRKGRHATGGKTRLDRVRASAARLERRHAYIVSQARIRVARCELYDLDLCDADVADVFVASDVELTGVEPSPRPDTDEILDLARARAVLAEAIRDLPPKWCAFMSLRLQNLTLEQCGQRLGLTRERCRQMEEVSIARLQKHRAIVAIVRGTPPARPVPARVVERVTLRDRAADINAKIAAFFTRLALERGGRVNPRREEPRRSERVRDRLYLAWIHTQPCCAVGLPGHVCGGRIEADHAGERPLGRKADDHTCIALCSQGHRERTDHSGPFKHWSRDEMRAWLDGQIAAHRAKYHAPTAAL